MGLLKRKPAHMCRRAAARPMRGVQATRSAQRKPKVHRRCRDAPPVPSWTRSARAAEPPSTESQVSAANLACSMLIARQRGMASDNPVSSAWATPMLRAGNRNERGWARRADGRRVLVGMHVALWRASECRYSRADARPLSGFARHRYVGRAGLAPATPWSPGAGSGIRSPQSWAPHAFYSQSCLAGPSMSSIGAGVIVSTNSATATILRTRSSTRTLRGFFGHCSRCTPSRRLCSCWYPHGASDSPPYLTAGGIGRTARVCGNRAAR